MPKLLAAAITALALASCAYPAPMDGRRTLEAQQTLDRYLVGKVAGTPQSCLPNYRTNDMVVVDEHTVLFRDGSRRVWRTEIPGGCNGLGRMGTAMVTQSFGGSGLCEGEIVRIVDTSGGGFMVGSCTFGEFVPYVAP